MGQRHVLGPGGVVDEDGVAVAEGAPPGVLAGQAHVRALEQQRPDGQRLAERPVDLTGADELVALGELPGQLRMDGEAVRHPRGHLGERTQRRLGDPGLDGRDGRPGPIGGRQVRRWRRALRPHLVERLLELAVEGVEGLLGLVEGDVAPTDQNLGVQLAHRPLGLDALVHERLGVARVVPLVVAVPAVADEVDDDVLVEPLAERERQPSGPHAGLGVVAVDVEDRRLDHLGHVGRVHRRPGGFRRGGEAELVVDDDVHRAADPIAGEAGEVQRLGDDALAGERGVAVDEQREDGVVVDPADHRRRRAVGRRGQPVLLGPGHALDDRVDGLEVRRVRRHRDRAGPGRSGR